jgi:hypothetical protein
MWFLIFSGATLAFCAVMAVADQPAPGQTRRDEARKVRYDAQQEDR